MSIGLNIGRTPPKLTAGASLRATRSIPHRATTKSAVLPQLPVSSAMPDLSGNGTDR